MKKPEPKKYLDSIKPYKGGVSRIEGIDKIYKLSSNENPFGPSPKAISEYKKVSNRLGIYPDSSNEALKNAISEKYSLDFDRIVCGCGSDEILQLLARVYLAEGDEGLISENAFAVYPLAIQSSGASIVRANENQFQPNINNFISSITDKTKIIYIANPNNPTGSYIKYEEIKRLYEYIPSNLLSSIFDPFVSSKKEGKGLGLSIVASGLEEMGAVIDVASNPGFTNFCMNFPLKKSWIKGVFIYGSQKC